MSRKSVHGAVTAFLLVLLVHGISVHLIQTPAAQRDFANYYYSVLAERAGVNFYRGPLVREVARRDGYPHGIIAYPYPPFFLLLVSPLGAFSLDTAYRIWLVVLAVLLGVTVILLTNLCARAFRPEPARGGDERARCSVGVVFLVVLAAAALPHMVRDNFMQGQANLVVLFFVVSCLYFGQSGNRWLSGIAAAFAIAIKLNPALLIPLFLCKRQIRIVTIAVVTFAIIQLVCIAAFGAEQLSYFVREVIPTFGYGERAHGLGDVTGARGNHSLGAAIVNACRRAGASGIGPTIANGCASVLVVVTLAVAFVTGRRGRGAFSRAGLFECGATLILVVMLPGIAWEHHLVLLLPAMVFVFVHVVSAGGRWWPAALVGVCAGVLSVQPTPIFAFTDRLGVTEPWSLAIDRVKTGAALALWATCLWFALRTPGDESDRQLQR